MSEYHAPGGIDELTTEQLGAWNAELSRMFDAGIAIARSEVRPTPPRAWLYNAVTDDGGQPGEVIEVDWTAFPRRVALEHATRRSALHAAEEDRELQSEYCEWETVTDPARNNAVVRVTFTTETPDYYEFLASHAPDHLRALYRAHVDPDIELTDLQISGAYSARNQWNWPQLVNARGVIMHMGQSSNAFAAAVKLSAEASWPRVDERGRPLTGEQELIDCREFGDPERHSDPHIGAQVNALVRQRNEVCFADPIGLYIKSIDTADWVLPDGGQPSRCIRVVRPGPKSEPGLSPADRALRVIIEAPRGADYILGDVVIGDENIEFGSQIAEKMRIAIHPLRRAASADAPEIRCDGGIAARQPAGETAPTTSSPGLNASRTASVAVFQSPE